MKLLFDENLSPKLPRLLAAYFPGSAHVRECGLLGQHSPWNQLPMGQKAGLLGEMRHFDAEGSRWEELFGTRDGGGGEQAISPAKQASDASWNGPGDPFYRHYWDKVARNLVIEIAIVSRGDLRPATQETIDNAVGRTVPGEPRDGLDRTEI